VQTPIAPPVTNTEPAAESTVAEPTEAAPRRAGWWAKRFFGQKD
jgi:hypothetical protein